MNNIQQYNIVTEIERFASIEGYDGYCVSSLGYILTPKGKIVKTRINQGTQTRASYLEADLGKKGNQKTIRVAHVIASCFLKKPSNKKHFCIIYKDGNWANVALSNIQFGTWCAQTKTKKPLTT